MKKKNICLLLLLLLLATPQGLLAQKDLQIKKVFEKYGKKKGVVMVELTNEVLGEYNFTLFKSITIKKNPEAAKLMRDCLKQDEAGAKKIKQVVTSGVVTSIYLQLPRMEKEKDNRLILYNQSTSDGNPVTLIYIETPSDTEDVLKVLLKKK